MTPEQIKKKRTELGYTQEEFAELLDVETQTVWTWESGRRSPSHSSIFTLINQLKPKK